MSNVWDRFEGIANTDEVETAKARFTPIDAGDYMVVLEKLEPTESQKGLPMLKGSFKTVEGGKTIFYNQMLQNLTKPEMTASNIADAVNFFSGIIGADYKFTGLSKFANDVSNIPMGGDYKINISYGQKDLDRKFARIKILEKLNSLPFDI